MRGSSKLHFICIVVIIIPSDGRVIKLTKAGMPTGSNLGSSRQGAFVALLMVLMLDMETVRSVAEKIGSLHVNHAR
jgi:hypothetical protein